MDCMTMIADRALGSVRMMQSNLQRPVRLLGLDVGLRRIGVAMCCDNMLIASPCGYISRKTAGLGNRQQWMSGKSSLNRINCTELSGSFAAISHICRQRNPDALIVGYPLDLEGNEGPSSKAVLSFIQGLEAWNHSKWNLPEIVLWEERYSTCQVRLDFGASGRRAGIGDGSVDSSAAALIMQSFLNVYNDGFISAPTGEQTTIFLEHLDEKHIQQINGLNRIERKRKYNRR
uniref:YqgF/RNase H-like domain-containing protein n=1 Tax=Spongospora subterranea TaxID=70186 RepID=A0A0H5R9J2_9EUKA|eukprot:CRZ10780.1 hypothetical protein [Spongospora subterranea]